VFFYFILFYFIYFIYFILFILFIISNRNYIIKCYLFKEGLIFPSFTLKLIFNSRVYFMKQNASVLGEKVSTLAEYAVTQGRSSAPRSVARAHCNLFAPITGRLRPSCTVRAMLFLVRAHCDPSTPSSVPFAPSHVPSAPSHIPSLPSPLPFASIGTSPCPFAFCPCVQEEVRTRRLQSTHAWV
jgi:hypothetical protein